MDKDARPAEFPDLIGVGFSAVRAFKSPCCSGDPDEFEGHPTLIWPTPLSEEALDSLESQWKNLWTTSSGEFFNREDRREASSWGVDVTLTGDELQDAMRSARSQLLLASGAIPITLWLDAAREFEYTYGCRCGVNHRPSYFDGHLHIVEHQGRLYLVPVDCDLDYALKSAQKKGLEAYDDQIGRNAIHFERTLRYRAIGSARDPEAEAGLRTAFALAQGSGDYSALAEFSPFLRPESAASQARAEMLRRGGVVVLTDDEARELTTYLLAVGSRT